MIPPKIPKNEDERLAALKSHNLLDTIEEQSFDDLTKIAAAICGTPISLISLIDEKRQWFKSHHGLDATETPRELAYCAHAINDPERILEVTDAFEDERFHDNPLATGDPHVRFYAGAPLIDSNGYALGTLCVIDHVPRKLDPLQKDALQALSRQVISAIELRKSVSDLEGMKRSLEAAEESFKNRIEQVGDMIFELNEHGKFIYVNPALIRISGFAENELLNMHYWDLITEDHKQFVVDHYTNSFKAMDKSSYIEFTMRTKAGFLWVGQNTEIQYQDARVMHVYGVARNIDELVETRRLMTESEEKYRLISENSQDLICLHEPDGKYKFLSSSVKDLLGYEHDELVGSDPYSIIHPDDINRIKENPHRQTLEGKSLEGIEYRIKRKDGTYIWMESYTKPILDEHGQVTSFQTSSRDITTRKEYANALKEAKEQAEKAKDEAIQSAKAKENFLSTMSHEIRTPLNAILGVTNLMLQENLSQDHMEQLELLRFSGQNLLTLINDILDYNKIEAGKIEIESIDFNLKEVLLSIKQSLLPKAQEKGLDLVLKYDDRLPDVFMGDSLRISQIINNLVSNSIKFTETGFVKVNVNQQECDDKKIKIHFEVEDTGIGISPENKNRIFENFAQASEATTRKYGGTGLGLTITKKLLNLMDSDINLNSKIGEGSVFSFMLELPIGTSKAKTLSRQGKTTTFESLDNKNISILVVEDNNANQIVLNKFLTRWGIKVDLAANGLEAVEKVKLAKYHIVLMDLQMPEMDGYEATKKIRSMSSAYAKELPIVALSASALMDIRLRAQELGMTDFITKPFDPDELYNKIKLYCEKVVIDHNSHVKENIYWDKINDYADGDEEFVIELAHHYIENYTDFEQQFISALIENDSDLLQESFKKIQSSNQTLEVVSIDAIMEKAQQMIEEGNGSKPKTIKEIKKVCTEVTSALKELIN